MPRYFFHARSTASSFNDEIGGAFADDAAAMRNAARIASELELDHPEYETFYVAAVDDDGRLVGRVPVRAK